MTSLLDLMTYAYLLLAFAVLAIAGMELARFRSAYKSRRTCRDESYALGTFVCSECGSEFDTADITGRPTVRTGGGLPRFCPACGAEVLEDEEK